METDPHTQPLLSSPVLDFSTDRFSGGLAAKAGSPSHAFLASTAGLLHPKPAWLGAVAGSVWRVQWGVSDGPDELKGGQLGSERHSVPTALILVEPVFLSLRHLCDGDLTEKKKGLYVGIP